MSLLACLSSHTYRWEVPSTTPKKPFFRTLEVLKNAASGNIGCHEIELAGAFKFYSFIQSSAIFSCHVRGDPFRLSRTTSSFIQGQGRTDDTIMRYASFTLLKDASSFTWRSCTSTKAGCRIRTCLTMERIRNVVKSIQRKEST